MKDRIIFKITIIAAILLSCIAVLSCIGNDAANLEDSSDITVNCDDINLIETLDTDVPNTVSSDVDENEFLNAETSAPTEDITTELNDETTTQETALPETTSHTHSYTITTVEPTCISAGFKEYLCECGDHYTEKYAPKTDHTYIIIKKIESTCILNGYAEYACDCGMTYTETLDKLDHKYKASETPATCTSDGYTTYTCECGLSHMQNFTEKLPHEYQKSITEATCTSDGCIRYVCSCGDTYTERLEKVEHRYVETVVPATCSSNGYTRFDCVCGSSYKDFFTPTIEHNYSVTSQLDATCVKEGYVKYRCICGDTYAIVAPITEHSYTVTIIQPTCTKEGYSEYVCVCGKRYTNNYADKINHSWKEWHVVKEATTTSQGSKTRECAVCKKSETAAIAPKKALDISQITPVNIFAKLSPNARVVADAILECIDKNYDGESWWCDIYLGEFELTKTEKHEIEFCLINYFGTFYGTINETNFYPFNDSQYEVILTMKTDRATSILTLERDRREMMATINNIISTFEDGPKERLIEQAFEYLINNLSYQRDQNDALTALKTGRGNCTAYGNLFTLMLAQMGIDSDSCVGLSYTGGYHLWNRVTDANGQYKYYDLTFYDASRSNKYFGASSISHKFFALNRYLKLEELT